MHLFHLSLSRFASPLWHRPPPKVASPRRVSIPARIAVTSWDSSDLPLLSWDSSASRRAFSAPLGAKSLTESLAGTGARGRAQAGASELPRRGILPPDTCQGASGCLSKGASGCHDALRHTPAASPGTRSFMSSRSLHPPPLRPLLRGFPVRQTWSVSQT